MRTATARYAATKRSAAKPEPVDREKVQAALQRVPVLERQVLELACFDGRTQREIAAITGTSLDAVKRRMLAGMRRLRSELADAAGTQRAHGRASRTGA